jgi:hypothetical protein
MMPHSLLGRSDGLVSAYATYLDSVGNGTMLGLGLVVFDTRQAV